MKNRIDQQTGIPGDLNGVNQWFRQRKWLQGWGVLPHPSINTGLFAEQYFKTPERWDLMFRLLKTTNFSKLEPGRHEVDGDNLYFNLNQYVTKDKASVQFEAHRKYIDLQYVFEGEELIGMTTPEHSTETEPYNFGKDIAFYKPTSAVYYKATPSEFLLFFPEELHQPGVRVKDPVPVRKIIFKIKYL